MLPLANTEKLYAACRPPAHKSGYPRAGNPPAQPAHSPFHLAIRAKNWDSLPVLATRLDSSRFRLPLKECHAHYDFCLNYKVGEEDIDEDSDDSAVEDYYRYRHYESDGEEENDRYRQGGLQSGVFYLC